MAKMTLITAQNPRWGDANKSFILIDCEFLERRDLGLMGFMASPNDPEPHGVYIFQLAKAGEFGPVAPYTPPPDPSA